MKKILIVSNMYPSRRYPSYGVFVKNFCDQLKSLGYDFDLSVITKTSNRAVKILKYLGFYASTFFRCLSGKYDLVYVHYPSFSAAPVNLARKIRKFKLITNVHGTDVVPLKKEHEQMLGHTKTAIDFSKMVVVPSAYYKALVMEKYGIEESRVFVYPSGGVHENVFFPYDAEIRRSKRAEFGVAEESFVLGFVSRINKAKGWDVFIEAIKQSQLLMKTEARILIVGSGEDDALLSKEIESLPKRLKDAVIRFPLLDQGRLADIYNILDVFLFPTTSASESLGLVALEAMSCGVPVIASDYAAPAYYVNNGENGYKFAMGNSSELAQTLDRFMALSEEQIMVLKKGALETAHQYARKTIVTELNQLLDTMQKSSE